MKEKGIDFERIKKLMQAEVSPDNTAEWAFIKVYQRAVAGGALIGIILDMQPEMDYYGEYEYSMVILGYAMGQKDFLDKVEGLDLAKVSRNENEEIH